ncbi:MAG: isoprenyl transferase [Deltaproteobacteria bacterium]|nr:isoprenyl transferase [Deltaproteobacteria bacterium]
MPPAPPNHIAIIMDGNGRWAEERGRERLEGHKQGAVTVREITTACRERGVKYLTLYSFSTENWSRPEDEVDGLMDLLRTYLKDELPTLLKNGVKLATIGDIARLPLLVRTGLEATKAATSSATGMQLTLALSYGSRDEILQAARQLARDHKAGKVDVDAVDHAAFSARLETAGMPDPDLVIRTSGEMRISNFLLWQLAYAELYFCDVAWPDFTRERLDEAIAAFHKRQRRFGKTGAQASRQSPLEKK